MDLKADAKGLSSFSLTDLKQKRQIKRDIAKEKVLQKKKKLEIRKERRVIKEARKEYGKHIKAQINKFKEKVQQHMKARKHEKKWIVCTKNFETRIKRRCLFRRLQEEER